MDDLDRRLLSALARDARAPVSTLARDLDVARSTVQARIERLERSGVIAGYTLRLGREALEGRIRATVLLQIEPRATPGVLQRLRGMSQVERANTTSGRFDLTLEVSAETTAELDETLDRIGAITGVRSSESLIQLATKIDRAP
ncbi:AsnC family transcriptional regulator [Maritimibacter sp. 55A14]|uniref:Lrp/AsnC family transcriptional regulator n=1 Tax=Maritimibacter sp. 55A14 TaxID=2174844 RepID=UPI000D621F5C|nr:Lrp/AsnC family transcriptional regulator [Maritimibacter sp. 55A14]PWE32067.1 AsnC family transcriptional regulator [Maritimibacter sp. 55A14]